MDVLHPRCCGLDVHKSSISACILLREAGRVQKHQRRFGAMTQELQALAEWLRHFGVTQVAMESSGVYWKPVWNILEGQFTARTKNTYLSSQFRRLAARRGKKRAIIAVAHTLIVIGYHLQKNQSNYDDLGGNYFDRIHSDGLKRYLVKRLEQLGHKVTLEPIEAA
jgi:transposase